MHMQYIMTVKCWLTSKIHPAFFGLFRRTRKQIDTIGGETVQPLATIVIDPFLIECAPREPFSTPRD